MCQITGIKLQRFIRVELFIEDVFKATSRLFHFVHSEFIQLTGFFKLCKFLEQSVIYDNNNNIECMKTVPEQ